MGDKDRQEKQLTPEARALLDSAAPDGGPPPDLAATRKQVRAQAREFGGDPEPVATVEEVSAGGVEARLYLPDENGRDKDVLVWLHGGGWTTGDVESYDNLARALARGAGCAVLSVEYRLAPEHPYPAAVDDAWAATRWAAARFEQVAVGGDSAGANLGLAVALRARDADLRLAFLLLVYPLVDPGLDSPYIEAFVAGYDEFGEWRRFGATVRAGIGGAWEDYVPDPERRREPEAAPAFASSLADLPPALFVFAEHDILRGEGEAFAARLSAAGVPVEIVRYPAQIHGFYHLLALADARDAVRASAAALQSAFATGR
jgi:acetyl esterase